MTDLIITESADGAYWADQFDNRATLRYWGSAERAKASLGTLRNCSDCSDCSRCSDCSGQTGVTDPEPVAPTIANIHTAVYVAASAPGALDMAWWRTCGTTHCRAGWVVHLAGEAGAAMESFYGTGLAAQLIYLASDPANPVPPTRFFDNEADALADMKRLADLEVARAKEGGETNADQ